MSAAVADHRLHSHFSAMGTTGGDGSSSVSNGEGNGYGNGNGSSGFSEEDLLASFGCFAVEGQTERDLATIKSMLSSTNSGLNNAIGRPAGAASFGWPFQTATMQQQQQCLNNPPPNTPTLSKSMDLAGNPPEMQYFGNGFPLNGSGSRRRDVSLDRSYNGSSRNSVTSTGTEQDDTMEDVEQGSSRTAFAGSIRPGMHKRKQSVNMDQMEGIQEESARDEAGDTPSQQQPPLHFHLASPPSRPSSAASNKRRQHTPPTPASPPQTRSRARQQAALAGF